MPEQYTPDELDHAGLERGAEKVWAVPNGGTATYATPEALIADRGTPDTIVVRSRKGRSTFEVTAGHNRYVTGIDPFNPVSDVTGLPNIVRTDHRTLVDWADRWVEMNDPGQHRDCTCDDLTQTVLVLDKRTRRPIWQSERQRYLTAERTVRHCHCRPFPALMGLDGGRRNAWHEIGPSTMSPSYRLAQARVSRSRYTRVPRRRTTDPGTPVGQTETGTPLYHAVITGNVQRIVNVSPANTNIVWVGHEARVRVAAKRSGGNVKRDAKREANKAQQREAFGTEATLIDEAMSSTSDDTVTITNIPGVTVTVKRGGQSAWRVTLVRGNDETTFRARTANAIARRVVA